MKIDSVKFVAVGLLMLILAINTSSAATIDVTSGQLPVKIDEKTQVNLAIKIKDYADTKQLSLETSLTSSENKPIWDFGELNSVVDGNVNRYQQKIILNLSSLPPVLDVSISGKTPDGETMVKCPVTDLVFSKFSDTKLKFFEARIDDKLAGIESFELVIQKQQTFEDTIEQIKPKEFDGVIREDRKLFNNGLTTEAQNIADELKNIKWPGTLSLFGIIKIGSDFLLDAIVIGLVLISLIIGYIFGSRNRYGNEEE